MARHYRPAWLVATATPRRDAYSFRKRFGSLAMFAALRLTLRTYEKWESGKPSRSNHFGVFRFAKTYGLTLDWLIAGDGEPPRFRPRLVS
jgi:hypothetical protein